MKVAIKQKKFANIVMFIDSDWTTEVKHSSLPNLINNIIKINIIKQNKVNNKYNILLSQLCLQTQIGQQK